MVCIHIKCNLLFLFFPLIYSSKLQFKKISVVSSVFDICNNAAACRVATNLAKDIHQFGDKKFHVFVIVMGFGNVFKVSRRSTQLMKWYSTMTAAVDNY